MNDLQKIQTVTKVTHVGGNFSRRNDVYSAGAGSN